MSEVLRESPTVSYVGTVDAHVVSPLLVGLREKGHEVDVPGSKDIDVFVSHDVRHWRFSLKRRLS